MSDQYLMGLDIGSGHGACLLYNTHNGDITTAVREWSHPMAIGDGGWAIDLDISTIWRLIKETIQEAMHKAGASPDQILAIGIDVTALESINKLAGQGVGLFFSLGS